MSNEAPGDGQGHFARTLTKLIREKSATVRTDGKRMSDEQVANGVNATAGRDVVSKTYVWQLRTGRRPNPTLEVILAFAEYFGVGPERFLSRGARRQGDAETRLIAALQDFGVLELATNAVGLSERSIEAMIHMAKHARQLEGLPVPEPLEGSVPRPRRVSMDGLVFVGDARSGQALALGPEYAGSAVTLYIERDFVQVELPDGARRRFARRRDDEIRGAATVGTSGDLAIVVDDARTGELPDGT